MKIEKLEDGSESFDVSVRKSKEFTPIVLFAVGAGGNRRLRLALDVFCHSDETVSGVGHSIGAATLVALAGGQMWLGHSHRIDISADVRLSRLALLAPPTGFFQAPRALDLVRLPILVWVGSEDSITPPSQISRLAQAIPDSQNLDVRVTDGAGHFSFMDQIPPHVVESLKDKQLFLRAYSNEVCNFVCG